MRGPSRASLPFALAALSFVLAGCAAGPEPIQGRTLEALKARVGAARPAGVVLEAVGPAAFAFDPGGDNLLRMAYASQRGAPRQLALFDRYFKVVFAVVGELREIGFVAAGDPSLWDGRVAALARFYDGKEDRYVDYHLAATKAFDVSRGLLFRPRAEKVKFLARHKTMLDALPLAPLKPGETGITEGELARRFFSPPEGAAYGIAVDVEEITVSSSGGLVTAGREARFAGTFRLRDRASGRVLLERRVERWARLEGSGVEEAPGGGRVVVKYREGEEPAELAVRYAVRAFAEEAIDLMPAAAAAGAPRRIG